MVPVVVITARDADDQIVKTLDAGADDYVVKPFSATRREPPEHPDLDGHRQSDAVRPEHPFGCVLDSQSVDRRVPSAANCG
jgi:DNA-binding NtrC family response regulator